MEVLVSHFYCMKSYIFMGSYSVYENLANIQLASKHCPHATHCIPIGYIVLFMRSYGPFSTPCCKQSKQSNLVMSAYSLLLCCTFSYLFVTLLCFLIYSLCYFIVLSHIFHSGIVQCHRSSSCLQGCAY